MSDFLELVYDNRKKKYNVLIVDDEALARTLLMEYVSKIPELVLVGSCSNALEALHTMQHQQVDILLTDIQMPDITGIEFIQYLNYKPSIIFTTAYSEYAIDGYDLGVIDYLLKPISFPRFFKAINKAIGKLRISNISHKTAEIEEPVTKNEQKDYLLIKADYRVYKVDFEDLIYLEGKQEYVTFHTKQRNITAYYSLKKLMEELPEKQFIRIHKSYIVALKYVEIIEGNHIIMAGEKLPIGGTFREAVMEILG